MQNLYTPQYVFFLSILFCACSVGGRVDDLNTNSDSGSADSRADVNLSVDNPFDPNNRCGENIVDTQKVPGHLLIVFDRSGSMEAEVGSSTRWDLAKNAVNSALAGLTQELNVGLALFPDDRASSECSAPTGLDVSISPISTSRSQVTSVLNANDASGGSTPLAATLPFAWSQIAAVSGRGAKAVAVVTDGDDSCAEGDEQRAVLTQAASQLAQGIKTYAIGLQAENGFLSSLAVNGGTRRNATCDEVCGSITTTCTSDAECTNGQTCQEPIFGLPLVPRECGCTNDAQCESGYTCDEENLIFTIIPGRCRVSGAVECCHQVVQEAGFQANFQTILEEIAGELSSCVFEVPSSTMAFDPSLVNVGVTQTGASRMVLPRSMDTSRSSWDFVDTSFRTLRIQGPVCDQIKNSEAKVEIVIGCATIPG